MTQAKILLHICCAPCSTHAILELKKDFTIQGFFFNPNMFPPVEYKLRLAETQNYLNMLGIDLHVPEYQRSEWLATVSHLRNESEGGKRCGLCYSHRLQQTAETAQKLGIPFFTTTLTVGPAKPAAVIFPIARDIAAQTGVTFVAQDFKKKDGFKNSCRMSRTLGMYRQTYCGCEYSLLDRKNRFR